MGLLYGPLIPVLARGRSSEKVTFTALENDWRHIVFNDGSAGEEDHPVDAIIAAVVKIY